MIISGNRYLSSGTTQWEPGANVVGHDPNPPINLEDPIPLVPQQDNLPISRVSAMAAILAVTCAFVPVVEAAATTTIAGQQGDNSIIPTRQIQYPSLTAPVFVPAVIAETVTIDKWQPHHPDYLLRIRWQQPAGSAAGPIYVPDVTVSPLQWKPTFPDRTAPRQQPQQPQGAYVPHLSDVVPALSWKPTYPDSTWRRPVTPGTTHVAPLQDLTGGIFWKPTFPDRIERPRRVPDFPSPVGPIFIPDVTTPVPVLSWKPTFPDRFPRPPYYYHTPATDPINVTAPPPETIFLDKWIPTFPSRTALPVPRQAQTVAPVYTRDTIPPFTWQPVYPSRTALPVPRQSQSAAPIQPPIRLDWIISQPQRYRALYRAAVTTSVAPLLPPVPPMASWQGSFPATTQGPGRLAALIAAGSVAPPRVTPVIASGETIYVIVW